MKKRILIGVAIAAVGISAWHWFFRPAVDIPFGREKIDFARLEHEYPLRIADLLKITPRNLKNLSQEQVDQI